MAVISKRLFDAAIPARNTCFVAADCHSFNAPKLAFRVARVWSATRKLRLAMQDDLETKRMTVAT